MRQCDALRRLSSPSQTVGEQADGTDAEEDECAGLGDSGGVIVSEVAAEVIDGQQPKSPKPTSEFDQLVLSP